MDFALPEIGDGVYEAELTAWAVHVGDVHSGGGEHGEQLALRSAGAI